MGACGLEHADGSMPMRRCDQKGEGGVIICFVVCLQTTYLYGNRIVQTGACGWKHVDGRVRMGAWGWDHCDGSNFFLTIYFQK